MATTRAARVEPVQTAQGELAGVEINIVRERPLDDADCKFAEVMAHAVRLGLSAGDGPIRWAMLLALGGIAQEVLGGLGMAPGQGEVQ